MRRSSKLIWQLVVSVIVVSLWMRPITAGEQAVPPSADDLIVDSEESRKSLLITELAVSRELIDMIRTELSGTIEKQECDTEVEVHLALTMIERIRSTQRILEQLGSKSTLSPWLRSEELRLRVLLNASAVEKAQRDLRELKRDPNRPIHRVVFIQCELLRAAMTLVPLQLELARVSGLSPSKESRVSGQWLQVEQRAKSLLGQFEECIESDRPEEIGELSATAGQVVEEIQRVIVEASDLGTGPAGDQPDATATRSHVTSFSTRCSQLLEELDASISEVLPAESPGAAIRSLQIRKLALLRHLLRCSETAVRLGLDGAGAGYTQALDENFHAELELCQTSGERIARCQQHIRRLKDALRHAEEGLSLAGGAVSRYELDRMKIRLIDVQILLSKEQQQNDSD
jgi:hypothetical protein